MKKKLSRFVVFALFLSLSPMFKVDANAAYHDTTATLHENSLTSDNIDTSDRSMNGESGPHIYVKHSDSASPDTDTSTFRENGESSTLDAIISSETQLLLDTTAGFPQVSQVYSDGSKGSGLCTSCATALMMKRKQIVDGFDATFNFYDIRMSFGLSRSEAEALRGVDADWSMNTLLSHFVDSSSAGCVWYINSSSYL